MKANLLTKHTGIFHISFISALLGAVMNGIFMFMTNAFHISNVSAVIILFTFVIYMILTPLTYQQQKFAILQSKMGPELQAVQAKYKGKKDQESAMLLKEETQFVYSKYGVTTIGSCLMPLINILILFNLLFVIYSIPAYITPVGDALRPLAEKLTFDDKAIALLTDLAKDIKSSAKPNFAKFAEYADDKKINTIIDMLYMLSPAAWNKVHSAFPAISTTINGVAVGDTVAHTSQVVGKMTDFFGVNISDTPLNLLKAKMYQAVLFPVLAAVTQFVNFKLTPKQANSGNASSDQMMKSMNTMNYIMPIFSAWFCLSFPVGIGIYWIAGPLIRCIQQVIINHHVKKIDIDSLVEKNLAIINEKRAKDGLPPVREATSLHNGSAKKNPSGFTITEEGKKRAETARKKINIDSSAFYSNEAKEGSLAAKARMVENLNKKDVSKTDSGEKDEQAGDKEVKND